MKVLWPALFLLLGACTTAETRHDDAYTAAEAKYRRLVIQYESTGGSKAKVDFEEKVTAYLTDQAKVYAVPEAKLNPAREASSQNDLVKQVKNELIDAIIMVTPPGAEEVEKVYQVSFVDVAQNKELISFSLPYDPQKPDPETFASLLTSELISRKLLAPPGKTQHPADVPALHW